MVTLQKVAFVTIATMLAVVPALAAQEAVLITKAMDDKAIITRRNGESYLIEKGVGCLSLWQYEGKTVRLLHKGPIE